MKKITPPVLEQFLKERQWIINTFESEIFTLKSIYIKTDTDTGIDDLERALK